MPVPSLPLITGPMPSLIHEGLVDLLRRRPELAFRLARLARLPVLVRHDGYRPLARAFVDPSRPSVYFEADLVLGGLRGFDVAEALDIEVQLGIDPLKFVSLPIYRAGVRGLIQQPAWSMLLSPVPRVLAWAEARLFEREPELRPALVGPDQVVPPLDPVEAREDPEWAVLRAVLHARSGHATRAAAVALDAIETLPEPTRAHYRLLLESAQTNPTRKPDMEPHAIRMPDVDDEISEFEKEGYLYQYGRDAGLEQGLEQGLALAREALIDLLEALGHTLDERARTKVAACREPEQLRAWLRGAREARSVDDLLT